VQSEVCAYLEASRSSTGTQSECVWHFFSWQRTAEEAVTKKKAVAAAEEEARKTVNARRSDRCALVHF
jgi:hypothetical protein